MQSLGSPDLMAAYHAFIASDHKYDIRADILDMEENVVGPADLTDGQINVLSDAIVHRTAVANLSDPDRLLGLDGDSVFSGSSAANRMLRIRHTVNLPGYGAVTCTPFVGPFSKVNRSGDSIDVEAQDKTAISIYGTQPHTVEEGMNAITAIRELMEECSGETRFRLPSGVRFKLLKPYSVSWADESAVWVRVSQIARAAGMQALYSCDGYLTVRPAATAPALDFGVDGIPFTVAPASESDLTQIVNIARVEADKLVSTSRADELHPNSAESMGRNGVPWYRPTLAELDGPGDVPTRPGTLGRPSSKVEWEKYSNEVEDYQADVRSTRSQITATSRSLLKQGLTQHVNLQFSTLPVFHLDFNDPIRVTTDEGSTVLPFREASIPLRSGEMSVGLIKPVSVPGRMRS